MMLVVEDMRPAMAVFTIDWEQVPLGEGWDPGLKDNPVWVDVEKLDRSWQRAADYVGPAGVGSNQPGKYENVGAYIRTERKLFMPTLAIEADGVVSFTDGRHRVAWLRDRGVEALPVATVPDDTATVEALFGTTARTSIVRLAARS
jgi:hypothetical protein